MCFLSTFYNTMCMCVFVSALTVEKYKGNAKFLNYHRIYRLLRTDIVLTQRYIEILSGIICTCDANKRKVPGSAGQTGCLHFKPTFFFFFNIFFSFSNFIYFIPDPSLLLVHLQKSLLFCLCILTDLRMSINS